MCSSGFSGSGRETGETGKKESRGRERTGKEFTGIRGNSSEKYSLTCTVKLIFVVVTDNRVVSSDCQVYAYTIYALQTIDSSALVSLRSSLPHSAQLLGVTVLNGGSSNSGTALRGRRCV